MDQSMNYPALTVKERDKRIEKSTILNLVLTPKGISDKICELNRAGRPRINKQRHLCHISKSTPPRTVHAEMSRKRLQWLFMMGLVHDYEPPLSLPRGPPDCLHGARRD